MIQPSRTGRTCGECLRVPDLSRGTGSAPAGTAKSPERTALFRDVFEGVFAIGSRSPARTPAGSATTSRRTRHRRSLGAPSRAVEQHAFGKRARPRFQRHGALGSAEGKTNAAGIRFTNGHVQWFAGPPGGLAQAAGLEMPSPIWLRQNARDESCAGKTSPSLVELRRRPRPPQMRSPCGL